MNSALVVTLVFTIWVSHTFCLPFDGACDSCGRECQSACGTRGFRTCCLNYLKKRSTSFAHLEREADTDDYRKAKMKLFMVLPELVEYYSLLKFFPSDTSEQYQINNFFEKQQSAQTEVPEPEKIS